MTPDLLAQLAALERQIATVRPEDAPALIGELERLKARLWGRMTSAATENGRPEAPAEDLRHLSVPKAAELLNLPKARVYELIRQGEIPAVRYGKNLRVPLSGLRESIARHQEKGLDGPDSNMLASAHDGRRAPPASRRARADGARAGRADRRALDNRLPLGAGPGGDQ